MVWTCLDSISPFCSCAVYVFILFLFSTLKIEYRLNSWWWCGSWNGLDIGFEWFWFHVGEAFAVRGGWVVRWLLLPKRCSAGRVFGWESWLRFNGSPDTFYMNPDLLISSFKVFFIFSQFSARIVWDDIGWWTRTQPNSIYKDELFLVDGTSAGGNGGTCHTVLCRVARNVAKIDWNMLGEKFSKDPRRCWPVHNFIHLALKA